CDSIRSNRLPPDATGFSPFAVSHSLLAIRYSPVAMRIANCELRIANVYQYFQRGTRRSSKAKDGVAPGVTTTRTQPTCGEPGTSNRMTLATVCCVARAFSGKSVLNSCESP